MIAIGPFTLDPRRRQLRRGTRPVPLEGRPLDILIRLGAECGQVVTKSALIEAVWPGRVVQDNNLAVHVSALRRLLGATEDGRPIIQTVPGRGYLLLGDRHEAVPEAVPPSPARPPRRRSSFIGRVRESEELARLVARHGLVTLTAAGGFGKTRLALHVADAVGARYPDGVHVAELATVDDPAQAAGHIARLFPLGATDRPVAEQICGFLRDRNLLLVLDNCEHVLMPVAHIAAAILERCPGVSILATSREPLDVTGEHVFRLSPLPLPAAGGALTPEAAMQSDAVRLFVERAAETVPEFVLDEATLPAILSICGRLDGIALAIEMAVPRLKVLSPAQLADRLRESLDVLATHDRTALPRNRTLRAVLDWSYADRGISGLLCAWIRRLASDPDLGGVLHRDVGCQRPGAVACGFIHTIRRVYRPHPGTGRVLRGLHGTDRPHHRAGRDLRRDDRRVRSHASASGHLHLRHGFDDRRGGCDHAGGHLQHGRRLRAHHCAGRHLRRHDRGLGRDACPGGQVHPHHGRLERCGGDHHASGDLQHR